MPGRKIRVAIHSLALTPSWCADFIFAFIRKIILGENYKTYYEVLSKSSLTDQIEHSRYQINFILNTVSFEIVLSGIETMIQTTFYFFQHSMYEFKGISVVAAAFLLHFPYRVKSTRF